jgi:hypothetical protein
MNHYALTDSQAQGLQKPSQPSHICRGTFEPTCFCSGETQPLPGHSIRSNKKAEWADQQWRDYWLRRCSDVLKTDCQFPNVFFEQQVGHLVRAVNNPKHRLVMGYGCGLRLEKLRTLHRRDIDFDKKLLRLRSGKGRKYRMIMLKPVVSEQHSDYLFKNDTAEELLTRRTVSKIFNNICLKAGILKLVCIQILRKNFATYLSSMEPIFVTFRGYCGTAVRRSWRFIRM